MLAVGTDIPVDVSDPWRSGGAEVGGRRGDPAAAAFLGI
jgi:predicted amidohydrolase YtcJ